MLSPYIPPPATTLAVALGANLPSPIGSPSCTLKAVRPILETTIKEWLTTSIEKSKKQANSSDNLRFRWSPLFETTPIGRSKQPAYINAVLVVDGAQLATLEPCEKHALELLRKVLSIENRFGRDRKKPLMIWGPRTLDIDLLAWGGLHLQHEDLILPHPRLIERSFVIVPLAAALTNGEEIPRRIDPHIGWLE